MNSEIENIGQNEEIPFDRIKNKDANGKEFWSSRSLANVLGYSEYRNFKPVIKKAQQSCFNSGQDVKLHFVQVNDMVDIGNDVKRSIDNILLSRYACYLIAQNADPSKNIVAKAQTYFAIQTRRQEINEQEKENMLRLRLRDEIKNHNKRLAGTAKSAGVVKPLDYAIFQNCGYMGLYNDFNKQDIHKRKKLKKGQEILESYGKHRIGSKLF